jgi:glycosyltransferase involved in cell wall biosynthesis
VVPSVSIISIARNNKEGLANTYRSVLAQTYKNWELILVVAPSQDGTIALSESLASSDPRIENLAQNGLGIYSAMNQGLKEANGDYVWFLNSGDEFNDDATLECALKQIQLLNADLLIGGYSVSGDSNSQPYLKSSKRLSSFEFAFNRRGGCHQAMLFHKKKVLEFGGFDIDFELASDFDLVMKIVKGENSFRAERVFACIEPGGVSDQRIYDVIREKHQIRRNHFERKTLVLFISIGWGIAVKSKIRARNFLRLLSKAL